MKTALSTTAGFAAHAVGSRPHAGQGFCAYPWHVAATTAVGHVTPNSMVIADSKLRFRWPEESSP